MAKPASRGVHQVFPNEDQIALRAYEMFLLDRDRERGQADYWRRAEDELLDRAARRVLAAFDIKPKRS